MKTVRFGTVEVGVPPVENPPEPTPPFTIEVPDAPVPITPGDPPK